MIDVKSLAENRRATHARLSPKRAEHRERAQEIGRRKDGIMDQFNDRITEKEKIRVIEGFFPTPRTLADEMVEIADLGADDRICEPEAGTGALADAIRRAGYKPQCIELSWTLAEVLRHKGYETICGDFLEHAERYDKILMNPPFENSQDIDHVLHAYELLNAGGRIVAIMSAGVFYRSHLKAQAFREWLSGVGWYRELPAGTFQVSGTGVNTCLVVIDKP